MNLSSYICMIITFYSINNTPPINITSPSFNIGLYSLVLLGSVLTLSSSVLNIYKSKKGLKDPKSLQDIIKFPLTLGLIAFSTYGLQQATVNKEQTIDPAAVASQLNTFARTDGRTSNDLTYVNDSIPQYIETQTIASKESVNSSLVPVKVAAVNHIQGAIDSVNNDISNQVYSIVFGQSNPSPNDVQKAQSNGLLSEIEVANEDNLNMIYGTNNPTSDMLSVPAQKPSDDFYPLLNNLLINQSTIDNNTNTKLSGGLINYINSSVGNLSNTILKLLFNTTDTTAAIISSTLTKGGANSVLNSLSTLINIPSFKSYMGESDITSLSTFQSNGGLLNYLKNTLSSINQTVYGSSSPDVNLVSNTQSQGLLNMNFDVTSALLKAFTSGIDPSYYNNISALSDTSYNISNSLLNSLGFDKYLTNSYSLGSSLEKQCTYLKASTLPNNIGSSLTVDNVSLTISNGVVMPSIANYMMSSPVTTVAGRNGNYLSLKSRPLGGTYSSTGTLVRNISDNTIISGLDYINIGFRNVPNNYFKDFKYIKTTAQEGPLNIQSIDFLGQSNAGIYGMPNYGVGFDAIVDQNGNPYVALFFFQEAISGGGIVPSYSYYPYIFTLNNLIISKVDFPSPQYTNLNSNYGYTASVIPLRNIQLGVNMDYTGTNLNSRDIASQLYDFQCSNTNGKTAGEIVLIDNSSTFNSNKSFPTLPSYFDYSNYCFNYMTSSMRIDQRTGQIPLYNATGFMGSKYDSLNFYFPFQTGGAYIVVTLAKPSNYPGNNYTHMQVGFNTYNTYTASTIASSTSQFYYSTPTGFQSGNLI